MVHTSNQPSPGDICRKSMSQEEPGSMLPMWDWGEVRGLSSWVKGLAAKPSDLLISRTHVIELAPASRTHNTYINLKMICVPGSGGAGL